MRTATVYEVEPRYQYGAHGFFFILIIFWFILLMVLSVYGCWYCLWFLWIVVPLLLLWACLCSVWHRDEENELFDQATTGSRRVVVIGQVSATGNRTEASIGSLPAAIATPASPAGVCAMGLTQTAVRIPTPTDEEEEVAAAIAAVARAENEEREEAERGGAQHNREEA